MIEKSILVPRAPSKKSNDRFTHCAYKKYFKNIKNILVSAPSMALI
jgi:hypothetical protein